MPALRETRLQLSRGLGDLGLSQDGKTLEQLLHYLELLEKWGRVHNLTGIRDVPSMVTAHLLDSLSVWTHVVGNKLLDVGSGAGLPGLPLAVAMPDITVTLLESRKKKSSFLNHAVASMGLINVDVVCERAEQYRPPWKFDTLVTRAFSTLAVYVEVAGHLCAADGRLVALKGRYPESELADIDQKRFEVAAVHPVSVPGLDASRHIVILSPLRRSSGKRLEPISK